MGAVRKVALALGSTLSLCQVSIAVGRTVGWLTEEVEQQGFSQV